jgi:type I restriction enzyme S subunit
MNVYKNVIINDDIKFGRVNINIEENQHMVKLGDAIFTGSSETPEEIGMSSIVLTNKKLYVNSFCQAYRFNAKRKIDFKYFAYYLRSKKCRT